MDTRTDFRLFALARRKRAQDERRWFKRQLVEAAFSGLIVPQPERGRGWWWGPSFDGSRIPVPGSTVAKAVGWVSTGSGMVTIMGADAAVDDHIAFVRRNRGR